MAQDSVQDNKRGNPHNEIMPDTSHQFPRLWLTGGIMGVILLAVDQLTKIWAVASFRDAPMEILPFFNFVLVWNDGVSFGMLREGHISGPLALTVLALVIMAIMAVWLTKTTRMMPFLAICSVMAGAAGNVIDRLRYGAVVDFLDFHLNDWHYPAFNVADCCVVVGIAFLLIDGLFFEPRQQSAKKQ